MIIRVRWKSILTLVKHGLHVCVMLQNMHRQVWASAGRGSADQPTVPAAAAGALHHAQPPPAAWPGHGDTGYTLATLTGSHWHWDNWGVGVFSSKVFLTVCPFYECMQK